LIESDRSVGRWVGSVGRSWVGLVGLVVDKFIRFASFLSRKSLDEGVPGIIHEAGTVIRERQRKKEKEREREREKDKGEREKRGNKIDKKRP